ncbi:MAG: glycosyltransferase [Roseburia hominis]
MENKVKIIPIAMKIKPWEKEKFIEKEACPTFTYVGRYVVYKGIDAAVEAIGKLKEDYPNAKLWILGKKNEGYIARKIMPICERYGMKLGTEEEKADIICWGFVSEEKSWNC